MVSIIIPVFNEKNYIKDCMKSVLSFDLQNEIKEIFLIDGGSNDGTIDIILNFKLSDPRIHYLKNKKKYQSFALNKGIKFSKGKYIMRLDAHSIYPKNYLERCLSVIQSTDADNVGGVFISKLKTKTYQEKIVQAITTHKFGVGNSNFRIKHSSGYARTVPFGFFKREVFDEIGLFNENLIRNQDFELNSRMIKNGLKIWLDSSIKVYYYNQTSFFNFLRKQFLWEGKYNIYMLKVAPYAFSLRHVTTGVYAMATIFFIFLLQFSNIPLLVLVFSYSILAFISSISQSIKYKNLSFIFVLPFCFFLFHFLHGLSQIIELIKISKEKIINQNKARH